MYTVVLAESFKHHCTSCTVEITIRRAQGGKHGKVNSKLDRLVQQCARLDLRCSRILGEPFSTLCGIEGKKPWNKNSVSVIV